MAHIKKELPNTTRGTGCQSWYLNPDGDPALWPCTWEQWCREMKHLQYADLMMTRLDPAPSVREAA